MTNPISIMLQNLGAIAVIWGSIWLMWDHNANPPGWLLIGGLAALIIGVL